MWRKARRSRSPTSVSPDAQKTAAPYGDKAFAVAIDVTKIASIEAAIDAVVARWGGVDILVNNAGVFDMGPIVEVSEASWDKVFAVNTKGLFFTLQAVAKRMIAQGRGGKIINFASQAGRRGEGLVVTYCASKAAVLSITQSAGLDLIKYHINVNGIAPGVVDTPMWDQVDALFAKYEHRPRRREEAAGRRGGAFRPHGPAGRLRRGRGVPRLVGLRLRRRADAQRRRRQLDELRRTERSRVGLRRRPPWRAAIDL